MRRHFSNCLLVSGKDPVIATQTGHAIACPVCVLSVFKKNYLAVFNLKCHLIKDLFQIGIAIAVVVTVRICPGVEGCLVLG